MRSPSHFGTWPPCSGRSALPDLRIAYVVRDLVGFGLEPWVPATEYKSPFPFCSAWSPVNPRDYNRPGPMGSFCHPTILDKVEVSIAIVSLLLAS